MSGAEAADDEIRFERRGALGLVTLDRPKALNALSLGMIDRLHAQLDAWAADARITRAADRHAGDPCIGRPGVELRVQP
ncbi:MAG: hypothetical protein EOO66_20155, partial [Methylobacterium sp.]